MAEDHSTHRIEKQVRTLFRALRAASEAFVVDERVRFARSKGSNRDPKPCHALRLDRDRVWLRRKRLRAATLREGLPRLRPREGPPLLARPVPEVELGRTQLA